MAGRAAAEARLSAGGTPISQRQIETIAAYLVAAGGLVICVQTVPPLLDQAPHMHAGWIAPAVAVLFGSVLLSVLFTTLGRGVRTINGAVAVAYFLVVVTWPLGVLADSDMPAGNLWIWYLCVIASAAAAIAFPVWLAGVYLVAAPVGYGIVRVSPYGGEVPWSLSVLDALYSVIISGAVLVLYTVLRHAAASVDAVQTVALARYARAVREQASEQERARVDALVHDSVLSSMLQAGRAASEDEQRMAAELAAQAIQHLGPCAADNAALAPGVPVSELGSRLTETARQRRLAVEWRDDGIHPGVQLPQPVAEALVAAAVQAMVNSAQHAGDGAHRWVAVGASSGTVRIEIGDTGCGFVVDSARGRLGLRVSIVERVRGVGGDVVIDTEPGRGTVVVLCWPGRDGRRTT